MDSNDDNIEETIETAIIGETDILFDLDNTIYPKESGLMDVMSQRMLQFMTQRLGIPADDVSMKRHSYYQRYGTTLRGLMAEYDFDPVEYLEFIHDVNPGEFFGPSPPLDRMLCEIPLRKIIFTNSDLPHSERVLNTLQVRSHFEMIVDICLSISMIWNILNIA